MRHQQPYLTILVLGFSLCLAGPVLAHRPQLEGATDTVTTPRIVQVTLPAVAETRKLAVTGSVAPGLRRDPFASPGRLTVPKLVKLHMEGESVVGEYRLSNLYTGAGELPDPTGASLATYGTLDEPGAIDAYHFTTAGKGEIPLELLVPARRSNRFFRPALLVVSPDIEGLAKVDLPLDLPPSWGSLYIEPPDADRSSYYEKASQEQLWHGVEKTLKVKAGAEYYLFVFEPRGQVGDYTLGAGTVEDFKGIGLIGLISDIKMIKLRLLGGEMPPWLDIIGAFLAFIGFGILLAGYLGAALDMVVHRGLGRIVSVGYGLAAVGCAVSFRFTLLSGAGLFILLPAVLAIAVHLGFLRRRERRRLFSLNAFLCALMLFLFTYHQLYLA